MSLVTTVTTTTGATGASVDGDVCDTTTSHMVAALRTLATTVERVSILAQANRTHEDAIVAMVLQLFERERTLDRGRDFRHHVSQRRDIGLETRLLQRVRRLPVTLRVVCADLVAVLIAATPVDEKEARRLIIRDVNLVIDESLRQFKSGKIQ